MFIVIDNRNDKAIEAATLFGKEAEKVEKFCNQIMWNKLYPYEGITHPASRALHEDGLSIRDLKSYGYTLGEYLNEYAENHPDEMAEYAIEKHNWDEANAKLFRQLYGIANRHHLHIKWNGEGHTPCYPDRFDIYKGGECIGMIQC